MRCSTPIMRCSTPSLRIVAVVLLVFVAGCGGAVDDGTDREPYGVETDDDGDELVPGLTNESVTDSSTLWNAHVDGVTDTSFERVDRTTVTDANGTIVTDRKTQTVAANGGLPVYRVSEAANEPESSEFWSDGNTTVVRHVDENGSATVYEDEMLSPPEPMLLVDPLSLYDAVDTVAVVESGDETRYHLDGSGPVSSYENATFEIVLDASGVVVELAFEGETTRQGMERTEEIHTTISSVGDPFDLEEPEWVDETNDSSTE